MNEQSLLHRLTLLEQRMDVQAREVSQMAAEIQRAMEGFAAGTSMALQVIADRLNRLETPVDLSTDQKAIEGCQHQDDGKVYTSLPPQYKCVKCGEMYEKA